MTSTLVMLDDDNFRKNTWYRDGKPHWAYNTPYLIKTTRRDWIEWTPNVISSSAKINGDRLGVMLTSCTPNFRTFQMKTDNGEWKDCDERLDLALQKPAGRFTFRTVNLFGVTGPEHRLEVARESQGEKPAP